MTWSTKQEQTHRLGEQIYSYQGQKVGWKGRLGVWDGHVHTAVFNMDNQQGPTVWHRELFSVLCDGLYRERIFKKKKVDICVCTTDSFCCTPETNTTLLINCSNIKQKCKPEIITAFWISYVLVALSYLTLCDPVDYSWPGSSVHGIL